MSEVNMLALADSRKASLARSTAQPHAAHVAQTTVTASGGSRHTDAECTESLAKDFSHLSASAGFVVLDRHGDFLAWSPCFLIAKRSCDQNPNAATVERCSDGALLARAPWGKAGQRKVTKVAA